MTEVVETTGAIRRAKLQSNRHRQQTNTQLWQVDAIPVAEPTVSKHTEGMTFHILARVGVILFYF